MSYAIFPRQRTPSTTKFFPHGSPYSALSPSKFSFAICCWFFVASWTATKVSGKQPRSPIDEGGPSPRAIYLGS